MCNKRFSNKFGLQRHSLEIHNIIIDKSSIFGSHDYNNRDNFICGALFDSVHEAGLANIGVRTEYKGEMGLIEDKMEDLDEKDEEMDSDSKEHAKSPEEHEKSQEECRKSPEVPTQSCQDGEVEKESGASANKSDGAELVRAETEKSASPCRNKPENVSSEVQTDAIDDDVDKEDDSVNTSKNDINKKSVDVGNNEHKANGETVLDDALRKDEPIVDRPHDVITTDESKTSPDLDSELDNSRMQLRSKNQYVVYTRKLAKLKSMNKPPPACKTSKPTVGGKRRGRPPKYLKNLPVDPPSIPVSECETPCSSSIENKNIVLPTPEAAKNTSNIPHDSVNNVVEKSVPSSLPTPFINEASQVPYEKVKCPAPVEKLPFEKIGSGPSVAETSIDQLNLTSRIEMKYKEIVKVCPSEDKIIPKENVKNSPSEEKIILDRANMAPIPIEQVEQPPINSLNSAEMHQLEKVTPPPIVEKITPNEISHPVIIETPKLQRNSPVLEDKDPVTFPNPIAHHLLKTPVYVQKIPQFPIAKVPKYPVPITKVPKASNKTNKKGSKIPVEETLHKFMKVTPKGLNETPKIPIDTVPSNSDELVIQKPSEDILRNIVEAVPKSVEKIDQNLRELIPDGDISQSPISSIPQIPADVISQTAQNEDILAKPAEEIRRKSIDGKPGRKSGEKAPRNPAEKEKSLKNPLSIPIPMSVQNVSQDAVKFPVALVPPISQTNIPSSSLLVPNSLPLVPSGELIPQNRLNFPPSVSHTQTQWNAGGVTNSEVLDLSVKKPKKRRQKKNQIEPQMPLNVMDVETDPTDKIVDLSMR